MIPDINDSDTEEIVYTKRKKTSHILSDDEELADRKETATEESEQQTKMSGENISCLSDEEHVDMKEPLIEESEQQTEISCEKGPLVIDDENSSDSFDAAKWKPLRRARITVMDDQEEGIDTCVNENPFDHGFEMNNAKRKLKFDDSKNRTEDLISDLKHVYKGSKTDEITFDSKTDEKNVVSHQSNKKSKAVDQDYASVETEPNENSITEDCQLNEESFDNGDSFMKESNTVEDIKESDDSQEETRTEHCNLKKSKKTHRTLKEIKSRKDEMLQIRSERQKHLRESTVRLPYYQPPPMTLTEFLERKERRKISLQDRPPRSLELLELEAADPRCIERNVLPHNTCSENLSGCSKSLTETSEQKLDSEDIEIDLKSEVLPNSIEQASDHSEIPSNYNPSVESSSTDKNDEACVVNTKTDDIENLSTLNLSQIKAKLKQMYGSHVPRLSGTPNSVIDFSEEQPIKSEVKHFIEKFVKHKEKTQKSTQECKNSKEQKKLAFELKTESSLIPQVPGARLVHIKEQLKEKMEERKEAIRKKRMEAFKLDNEDGFDENIDDDGINSEAELTDQTDTDEEVTDDDDDAVDSEEEEELEFGHLKSEKKQKKSIFIDEEASEDDADDEIDDDSDSNDDDLPPFRLQISPRKNSTSESINKNKGGLALLLESKKELNEDNTTFPTIADPSGEEKHVDDEDCSLHLALPIELEYEDENLPTLKLSCSPQSCFEDANTNFGSVPEKGKDPLFSCNENFPLLSPKSTQLLPPCLEDTNANFGKSQEHNGDSPSANKGLDNGDNSFELDRSIIPGYQPGGGLKFGGHTESGSEDEEWLVSSAFESQNIRPVENTKMNDENNLCMVPTIEGLHLKFEGLQSSSTELETFHKSELLEFGNISNAITPEKNKHDAIPYALQDVINSSSLSQKTDIIALCSGTFDNSGNGISQQKLENTQSDSVNMNELLDLCSGKFNESQSIFTEQDYQSDESIEIGHKKVQKSSQLLIEDSDSELHLSIEDTKLHLSEEELEDELRPKSKNENSTSKFKGFRGISGIRKEFLEEEAELSGSGVSEDENEDDDDDGLEDENNAFSDVNVSDEELKNQVERVHNKAVLDEEKRELLLLQERFLMDGDLHSDGQGRQRKFRWRNIDENIDFDNGNLSSEEEEKENAVEDWRLQRFEREKWLQEQEENVKSDLTSQKQDFVENNIALHNNRTIGSYFRRNSSLKQSSGSFSTKKHSGSFLAKGDAFLDRLAVNVKKEDEAVGRRCTKSIVFKASSPDKVKVAKKRENNLTPLSQNMSQCKKPKVNKTNNSETNQNLQRRSIFDFFDTK